MGNSRRRKGMVSNYLKHLGLAERGWQRSAWLQKHHISEHSFFEKYLYWWLILFWWATHFL